MLHIYQNKVELVYIAYRFRGEDLSPILRGCVGSVYGDSFRGKNMG